MSIYNRSPESGGVTLASGPRSVFRSLEPARAEGRGVSARETRAPGVLKSLPQGVRGRSCVERGPANCPVGDQQSVWRLCGPPGVRSTVTEGQQSRGFACKGVWPHRRWVGFGPWAVIGGSKLELEDLHREAGPEGENSLESQRLSRGVPTPGGWGMRDKPTIF